MGSMLCHCGCGMHNSDGLNTIELSLYKLSDVEDAVAKGVLLKDLSFFYKEYEVWRCPECGRWNFVDGEYNYRMNPISELAETLLQAADDDEVFLEHDIRSADNAYTIDGDISVSRFLNLPEDVVRLRYLRVNSRRMLVYRDAAMVSPVKAYLQEK